MPSSSRLLVLPLFAITACTDEPPAPDVSNLSITMRWETDGTRSVDIRIANPDIPCESESQCESAPWSLTVDGVVLPTSPVTCISAQDNLFGRIPKRCEGGSARLILREDGAEDLELVATSDGAPNEVALRGIRRKHVFVQELPFEGGAPGVVRVDDLALVSDVYEAIYTRPSAGELHDAAYQDGAHRLQLSPFNLDGGTYHVQIRARALQAGTTIAVPIEGVLTVGP